MTRRVLITGARSWTDSRTLARALRWAATQVGDPRPTIVHGACPGGADNLADDLADDWGWPEPERHPANWRPDGLAFNRRAGLDRNIEMVETHPDLVVAFLMPCSKKGCRRPAPHDSHGTVHCASQAATRGLPVYSYRPGDLDPAPRTIVTTSGALGGWVQPGGPYRPAPLPGPLVDTYGCGDSFAAGLTFALARGDPLEQAVDVAARCAAAVLTGRGPYLAQLGAETL